MNEQERYEQENPLVDFPRKPGHALRGDGWAWLDDAPGKGYEYTGYGNSSEHLKWVIATRMANSRERAKWIIAGRIAIFRDERESRS